MITPRPTYQPCYLPSNKGKYPQENGHDIPKVTEPEKTKKNLWSWTGYGMEKEAVLSSIFQWGKYNRRKVVDIIREDPYYIMAAVKDWLYLSPDQATYFSSRYNGEIPPKFIREVSPD